jgi:hypothetical protein
VEGDATDVKAVENGTKLTGAREREKLTNVNVPAWRRYRDAHELPQAGVNMWFLGGLSGSTWHRASGTALSG